MSRLFPERIPESAPDSEREVFRSLASTLSDEFAVFHGVAWHRHDHQPDGEADFLVAHPELGLLVLEVKGGGIDFEPMWGWFSTNRYGTRVKINDPFQQALTAKHAILRELKDDPRWPPRQSVQIGYAVCFPAIPITATGFTARGKPEITFGKNDLQNLGERVTRCLEYWRLADPADALGQHGFRAVVERYGRSWHLRIPLREDLHEGQRRIVELTERQMDVLQLLGRRRRAAVAGCAGAGKSLLAIARAQELAGEGKRVLLTCFNKALAEHWRASLQLPTKIEVAHFHGFCTDAVRARNLRPGRSSSAQHYYEWLPDGLLEAIEVDPNLRFDAIVVDEGQDFRAEWFEVLELLLRDDQSSYFIFYDDNQRLYSYQGIPRSFGEAYPLTKNVRNTEPIGTLVKAFHSGEMRLSGLPGRKVRFVDLTAWSSETAALTHVFQRLRDWGASASDVVVLTPAALTRSELPTHRRVGPWRLGVRESVSRDVLIETIHSFKGQDRPIVVLAELDRLDELTAMGVDAVETLLYVGCSRATQFLIVLGVPSLTNVFESHGAVVESRLGDDGRYAPDPTP